MLGVRGRAGLLLAGVAGLLMMLSLTPVGAASANISRSYKATGGISNGSLVSLDPQHSDYVQLADRDNGSRLLGVALASNDSLLAVSPTDGQVQVATNGSVNALVSTLNGSVGVGDEVGVSPFSGIGMKASPGSRIIGLAQTELRKGSQGTVTKTVKDNSGKSTQIEVGYVRVNIAISTDGTPAKDANLSSLQRLSQTLTGRSVSTFRVLTSLIVALSALLILVTLIYGAIYGSIVSIGRNPLAKYAVFRTLGAVLGLAVLTAVASAAAIFFLLR